ncbi:MAG: condensation domain-containing protein [Bacteroidota bacterium]
MERIKTYDAGFVQKREWMLYKIRADHYPFNLTLRVDLETFDSAVFQKVIDLLVRKHEILRTTLRSVDGKLKQVVHAPGSFKVRFSVWDLSEIEFSRKEQFIRTKIDQSSALPFNFEFGPLFKILVFKKGDKNFEVVFIFHHLIFDDTSGEIFKQDAIDLWNYIINGEKTGIPPPPPQYRKYTTFENELLETDLGKEHRTFWRNQLEEGIPHLKIIEPGKWETFCVRHRQKVKEVRSKLQKLPFYDERFIASVIRRMDSNELSNYMSTIEYLYSGTTMDNIKAFKRVSNSSMYTLFLASFVLVLYQLSGQELYAFDIPASRKNTGDFGRVIGWLAAGGICFIDVNKNTDLVSFLAYIDEQLFLLSKHCMYPFEAVGYNREVPLGSSIPLFFTLKDNHIDFQGTIKKAGVVSHEFEGGPCFQDVAIFIGLFNNYCKLRISYNGYLLSPEVIQKVVLKQEELLNTLISQYMGTPQTV